jgi:hypothetical protein
MNGAEQIKQFEAAGFSPEEIQQWSSSQAQHLTAAGFGQDEVGAWFGQKPEPDHAKANENLAKSVTGIIERSKERSKQTAADIGTLYGPVEMGLNAASAFGFGFPAYLISGGATAAMRGMGILSDDTDPKEIATRFSEAVTYQPFSEAGKRLSEALMLPLTDLTAAGEAAGKKVADVTESAGGAALTEATIQMLPAPFLGALGRRLSGKVPTPQSIQDTASAMTRTPEGAAVDRIAEKLTAVYEKTGLDPEVVYEAAQKDPTILQDLASSNVEVPVTISDSMGIPRPKGYWEGPEGTTDIEITSTVPTLVERAKELALNDRRWYASDSASAKDILAQGQAGVESGKTPEAALGEAMPPPPPEKPTAMSSGEGRSDAENTILSKIVTDEPAAKKWTFDKLYTELIDRYNPINTIEKAAGGREAMPGSIGPYEAQRLTAGVFGKGDQFLNYSTRDFNTYEVNGPSYRQALSSVRDDMDGFRAYMASRRAIELDGRGIESGFDVEAAKQVVKDGEAKFEDAFQQRLKYRDALVDYVVEAGLVSKKAAAAMREANKAYVSFYRYFDEETRPASGNQPRSPIKRIKGSERDIIDPIVSDIKDTFLFLSLAEKNAARQAFANMGPEFAKPIKESMRPISITGDELGRTLKDQGIEADPEGFTAFRPQSYSVGKDEIAVFENGKRKLYEVDPEVARAFNATDAGSASILGSMLRGSASWLRAGVTLSPDFIMRNPLRDALSAFVYAGSHPIKTVKGAISLWAKDEAFQRWQMGGGANAAMVSMDRAYIHENLFDLNEKTGMMSAAWNVAKSPLEVLRIASEIMENITRIGAVRDDMLQANSKAQIQALSLIAREATVDFARHGADPFMRQWEMGTAFMNPAKQGIDLMFRKMKEDPTGVFARAFAAITLPSLYLWWTNHDDPRWKDIPNWERDMFWIVFTKDHTYRIPKPFELGVLFGSVPERMLDAYVDDKPDAFKQFGKTMLNVFGFNVIPTVGIPPLEHMTNYSMFTDKPIIPRSMEKILPEYQYTPYTTQATKALGHIVGTFPGMHDSSFASPAIIDNYIRGWSGTLGTYAVQIADAALRKTGVLPDPIRPAKTLADIPGIRAFVVRYPSAQAQSIQDFYDNYAKAEKVVNTVKSLAMQGDATAALREAQLDPAAMGKLDGIHQGLGNAQLVIQTIDRNQSIPPDEKRQLIDATYMQMIQMATAGNDMTHTVQKMLKARPVVMQSTQTVH